MTSHIQQAKGIPPHAYAAHVTEVLARSQAKRARRRRYALYAVAVPIALTAYTVLPAYIAAAICISLPCAILCAVLASSWRESREYNKEHDLP
jgi:hypothetical protein